MKMFRRNCTYRHDTSGALDIHILSVSYYDENRSILKIRWVSKVSGKFVSFPGGRADGIAKIEIQSLDYKYWRRLND
jgi:hypothetical protein